MSEAQRKRTRLTVHLIMATIFFVCIIIFKWVNDKSIIGIILTVAGYTYGPLLGLFAFGIFSRRQLPSGFAVVFVCFAAPVICYFLSLNSAKWFNGFQIGIELLLINGLLTYLGLLSISTSVVVKNVPAYES